MKLYKFLCVSFCLLTALTLQAQNISKDITVQQADSLIKARANDENFVILDIRTDMEVKRSHLKNSVQINYLERSGKKEMWRLDKDKAYLIYCRSGKRSKEALGNMEVRKFKEVYNMLGGIKEWKKKGLAVEEGSGLK